MRLLQLLPVMLPLFFVSVSPSPCNFPAIFNLGDSNSDTGGFSAAFGPTKPPNGETYFGLPSGRFSDGRLIIDFIAESLGLPYLSAYLDSLSANFSHGANFASTSATIIDQNVSLSQGGFSPFTLGVQLNQFTQFKTRSQLVYSRGGAFKELMPREEYFSQALYTVYIGQNDLTAVVLKNQSASEPLTSAIAEFSRVIKSIYELGGRNFWIHNSDPIGCHPSFLARLKPEDAKLDSAGCATVYNKLAQRFNSMLNDSVVDLRRELHLASFTYVDIYAARHLLVSQAEEHGFENPLAACCGHGGGAYNFDPNVLCGATGDVNGTETLLGRSCVNPSKRVSWDGIHSTEAANKWVFDRISSGEFSDPPNSLNMACRRAAHRK